MVAQWPDRVRDGGTIRTLHGFAQVHADPYCQPVEHGHMVNELRAWAGNRGFADLAVFLVRTASILVLAGIGSTFVAGCRAQSMVPVIESVTPSSGSAGGRPASATLTGSNFAPTGNTVLFGPVSIENLSSKDGETLRFAVPTSRPATGEVPPMVFPAGTYEIRVRTAAGTSNSVTFELGG